MKVISEKREALASQRRAVEILEAEIRGMEAALALFPTEPVVHRDVKPANLLTRSSGGRQPGAISNRWKRHLLALDDAKTIFSLEDVIELVAEREKRFMRPSEVKRIFDKYVEQGHVEETDELYTVPDLTVQKFKAALRDAGDDVQDEDEAASVAAEKDKAGPKQSEPIGYDLDDDIPFEPTAPRRQGYNMDDDIPF